MQIGCCDVEQHIEVPKLSTQTRIYACASVPEQTAEQMVEVPVLCLDECFLVLQVVERLVEVPQIVSQQSRASPSRARLVKQLMKVSKSCSCGMKRTVEGTDDSPTSGRIRTRDRATSSTTTPEAATSSGYGVSRTFCPVRKKCDFFTGYSTQNLMDASSP